MHPLRWRSLWAAAGIGMAAGASRALLAVAATVIVLVSQWQLRLLSEWIEVAAPRRLHTGVLLGEGSRLADLRGWLAEREIDSERLDSE